MAAGGKNPKKRRSRKRKAASCSHLPDEIWERIFKFLDGDNYILEVLSVVSKQFLSITNRLRCTVKISDHTIPFLSLLFERFPNLTSLNILSSKRVDIDALLTEISTFPLDIKSLTLYDSNTVPADGLRALSKKMKNLTSLNCYRIVSVNKNDLFLIADCFPLLEELIVKESAFSCPRVYKNHSSELNNDDQPLALPKLRKINVRGNFLRGQSIYHLCRNCELLQELKVFGLP